MSATPRAVVASPKGKQSIHEEDALGEALDFELLKRL